jgi:methylthioribose-1-phosphate isomerase
MREVEPIRWSQEGVVVLDQRRLPGEVVYYTYTDYVGVADAIREMVIRGAPAIGLAAVMFSRGLARRPSTSSGPSSAANELSKRPRAMPRATAPEELKRFAK